MGDASNKIVFDLYCGIGTIGIYASKFVKKVYGIELAPTDYIKIAKIFIELDSDEPFGDGVEKKVLNIQI